MPPDDSVCVLYPLREGPWGGGNQFLKALRGELIRRGLHEPDPARAGMILTASWQGLARTSVAALRQQGTPVILRVDGPVSLIRGRDQEIDRVIYRFARVVADGTVFQSGWSRDANLDAGMRPRGGHTTIINAPDPELFSRDGKQPFDNGRRTRLIATSWSPNRRKGFDFYEWLDSNLDFERYEMSFIGNSPVRFANIRLVPPLDSRALAAELKAHDIYLTGSRFDPCSNSLLEALHCGLPAVAVRHGGHPEIIGGGGETFEEFGEAPGLLERIVSAYAGYQDRIAVRTLSEVVDAYLEFMRSVRDRVSSTPPRRRWEMASTAIMARAVDFRTGRALLRAGYAAQRSGSVHL